MRVALLLLALTAGLGTTGCGPVARLRFLEQRDTTTLAAAANDYWLALRWNDPGGASLFLETPEQRVKLGRLVSAPTVRITDAAVVQVVVGPELPEERRPETREGIVVVRIEGYDIRRNRLDVATVEQHWVRDPRGWKVDAELSPLGDDRPW